jgi:DNA-binding MarR family transcriptional regulator
MTRRAELIKAITDGMGEAQGQGTILSGLIAERLGLSTTELETLGLLQLRGPLSAGEIAGHTGLTSGAVTRLIDRLESSGNAKRRADPNDRRRVLVEITPAARRAGEPFYGPLSRGGNDTLSRYSDKELELILDFITRSLAVGVANAERIEAMPERPKLATRPRFKFKAKVLGQRVRIKI